MLWTKYIIPLCLGPTNSHTLSPSNLGTTSHNHIPNTLSSKKPRFKIKASPVMLTRNPRPLSTICGFKIPFPDTWSHKFRSGFRYGVGRVCTVPPFCCSTGFECSGWLRLLFFSSAVMFRNSSPVLIVLIG